MVSLKLQERQGSLASAVQSVVLELRGVLVGILKKKNWGSKQGGWRGLREIERVKVPVDSIPKAHPALRDQIARWSRSAGERKIAVANKPGCKLLWFGMPKWKP